MSVLLNTPAADLGESCKVYTCGAMPGNLMAGLAVNNITPEPIAHDNALPAPSAPPAEFMADFKAPTPGGMG
jgi:hypothetical protein